MAEKKILDVAKPDTTPANETAKPVIVGHKPMVLDPMVNEDSKKTSTDSPAKAPSAAATQAHSIKSLSADVAVESNSTKTTQEAPKTDEIPDKDPSKTADDELEQQAKKQAELKELVATKKYFVSVSNPTRSSAKAFILTVAAVLLIGLLVLLVLHDSGIIDLGIKLPFDLIK